MTRKEALKQIAQRCMEGEDVDATELYNVLGKRTDMGAMESLVFYIALPLSLDAVAKLEAESLPDLDWRMEKFGDEFTMKWFNDASDVPLAYGVAKTEPLARLAALCLALAEI